MGETEPRNAPQLRVLMGKASRRAQAAKQPDLAPDLDEEQDEEHRSWRNFDKKEKGIYALKWAYVFFFWYYFYTWAGGHSGEIDDQQVRYYLWYFDQAKTMGGLTMAILTFMESQKLLSGGKSS